MEYYRERILIKKHKQAVGLIASLNESMALADKERWASLREGLDQHYFDEGHPPHQLPIEEA
jgi:hypothetical protein